MSEDARALERAYMRTVTDEVPTLDELIRHAERFGTECVYETAESYGYPLSQLLQLDAELTRIDTARRKRFGTVPERKRPSARQKREAVGFLTKEGLPASRIAKVLGIGTRQVERLRQQWREDDEVRSRRPADPTFRAQVRESPSPAPHVGREAA